MKTCALFVAVLICLFGGQPIGRIKPARIATEFTLDSAVTLPE